METSVESGPQLVMANIMGKGGFGNATFPQGMRMLRTPADAAQSEAPDHFVEMQRTLGNMLLDHQRFSVQSFVEGSFVTSESLVAEMQRYPVSPEALSKVGYLHRHGFIPLFETQKTLCLGVKIDTQPGAAPTAEELTFIVENELLPRIQTLSLPKEITIFFLRDQEFSDFSEFAKSKTKRDTFLSSLSLETSSQKVFQQIVHIAVTEKASDIHIEPTNGDNADYQVRYRIDGMLHRKHFVPASMAKQLIAVIKNEAGMKLDESRRPQDGRISFGIEDIKRDPVLGDLSLRASVVPAVGGNKAVLRLLRKASQTQFNLDKLGFPDEILRGFEEITTSPNGLILVTGPTGSGKTTTLYSLLTKLNTGGDNIVTIEDPVEVELPGITQVQVNKDIGLTFAAALRSFLRQDPDIILVGEIRDAETAEMAAQAALTGHIVFATVHTNDSFATLARLRSLGLSDSQVHDTLRAVFSQRLVRALCQTCHEKYDAKDELNKILGSEVFKDPVELHKAGVPHDGKCCPDCNGVGYAGRIVIPELWKVGPKEQALILEGRTKGSEYLEAARAEGMNTMLDYSLSAIGSGYTSIHECLARVFSVADLRNRSAEVERFFRH